MNLAQMHKLLILDFGSQYTQLIARRVREMGVYCEIFSYDCSEKEINNFAPNGIILSGGPESVLEKNTPRISEKIFNLKLPILGICYGMQCLAIQLGGKVGKGTTREFGAAKVKIINQSRLMRHLETSTDVWMSHGDHVQELPPSFSIIASSDTCTIAGMADEAHQIYGLQFHPEVSHSQQGKQILSNFIFDICGCEANWLPKNIIHESIKKIKTQVGSEQVILGLSGGVDSSVVAALLHQAIGDQLTCVFVDTGLLRLNEREEIQSLFSKHFGMRLITVDAADIFYSALAGVVDPEKKRKLVGKLFIEIFNAEAKKIKNAKWLAQGTIYPDVIESASHKNGKAHTIKSHHNVGGLPEEMHLGLIEPLRELFKDEVRKIGLELGLPSDLVYRHPFPGPGLAIRILGEIKKEHVHTLRRADAILIEELRNKNLYEKVGQAFAVFLPIKSVGVLGDARHYDHVVAVRVIESLDFMTAHTARLPHEFLEHVSNRIVNEVPGISRVVYDISSKPPATIEWE